MGEPDKPCPVCAMFKGAKRPRPKHTEGRPREIRPGHRWHMDLINFRHRSEEGCKYLVILTDEATQFFQFIPLHWKSDAPHEIERWINALRAHPACKGRPYQVVGNIFTDNESVWDEEASEFQAMVDRVGGLLMEYGDPADHARDNARAEGSNKVVEAGIQSLLYDKNLPPSWWQRAANDVMFLANRLPPYSIEANVPPDGDVPSPIERLLEGYVSRHQVYREIDCFVPVGTPALCHAPKVKGSDLEPKVRWGISIGQRGKVTRWMCPFTKSRFRNRSFTSFSLRSGLNWSQFLGLGDIAPGAQSRMYPGDNDPKEVRVIELPEPRPGKLELPPAVLDIVRAFDDREVKHALSNSNGDSCHELCEYFPRIRQTVTPGLKESVDTAKGREVTAASDALPLEGGELSAIRDGKEPPPESEIEALTPGVVVTDSKGRTVGTRPTLHGIGEHHPDDADNLYVDGCAINAPPKKRAGRPSTRGAAGLDRPSGTRATGRQTISQHKPTSGVGPMSEREGMVEQLPSHDESTTPGVLNVGSSGLDVNASEPASEGKHRNPRHSRPKHREPDPEVDDLLEVEVDDFTLEEDLDLEELEARAVEHLAEVTDGRKSWSRICRNINAHRGKLPIDMREAYRIWLLTRPTRPHEIALHVEDLPKSLCESRSYLPKGMLLPYPSGPHWRRMMCL